MVEKGGFAIEGQEISDLNTSVVFDFNRVEVQSLKARVGKGTLAGQGGLGLFRPTQEAEPLTLTSNRAASPCRWPMSPSAPTSSSAGPCAATLGRQRCHQ